MSIPFITLLIIIAIEYIGLARYVPIIHALHFSSIAVLSLTLYYLVTKNYRDIMRYRFTKLFIWLIIITVFTIAYSLVKTYAYLEFRAHLAYFMLFFITYYTLDTFKKFRFFLLFLFAVHIFIIILNFPKFGGGPRVGAFLAGYFYGDGNDLAWGLAVIVPFTLHFIGDYGQSLKKYIGIASAALLTFGILGTQSRGATIAMAAMFGFFIVRTRKFFYAIFLGMALVVFAIYYAPTGYFDRMESIQNYRTESSAQMRLRAWKAATLMAVDHPLGVGAGNFSSAYGRFYQQRLGQFGGWAGRRWISPHSIFFSVLGEYGILGLIFFLVILYSIYRTTRSTLQAARGSQDVYDQYQFLLIALPMSLIGYAAAGAFLSGVSYPHFYLIAALVARADTLIMAQIDNAEETVLLETDTPS